MIHYGVSQAQLKQWANHFVVQSAPFFLTDTLRSRLPPEMVVLKRQALVHLNYPLWFHDAYTTYSVRAHCQYVTFLRKADLLELAPNLRTELLYTQWQCGRGQIYDWETVSPFFKEEQAKNSAIFGCTATPEGIKFVLDFSVWQQMAHKRQVEWLYHFMALNQHPYPTLLPGEVDCWAIKPLSRSLILNLANTFASDSGPNCFSTTLAAITENPVIAQTISTLWLHPEPFMQGLDTRGYRAVGIEQATYAALVDAVCLWRNQQGIAQHACYVIGNGIALNKNSQAWYAPRHLAYIDDIINYWREDELSMSVYTHPRTNPDN